MSTFHGSDLEKIEERYGIPRDQIISFAANVSPLGISDGFIDAMKDRLRCIEKYPERDYRELRTAVSKYCGVPTGNIIVGNGSSELIGAVIRHRREPRTLIVAPAYSEYERYVKLAGGEAVYCDLKEEESFELDAAGLAGRMDESFDLLIICNPLNPTSGAVKAEDMRVILDRCEELGMICMVDETYVDFADEVYDASYLTSEYKSLFVIRSMSKFFCAPGLRLGYALTSNRNIISEIDAVRDPWSVSSFAETAGAYMLSDREYIGRVKAYIAGERERVCVRLSRLRDKGIKYYTPKANFVLVRLPEKRISADRLFETAIRKRMMIRDCSSFRRLDESYVRFCFMKREDNDRLLDLIEETVS